MARRLDAVLLRNKGVADPGVTCESMADGTAPDELSYLSDAFIVAAFSQALFKACAGFG